MNDIHFYILEVKLPKIRLYRMFEYIGIDAEDAVECFKMEHPDGKIKRIFEEVKL
jgi:hypothetical protein